MMRSTVSACLLVAVLIFAAARDTHRKRTSRLPPGPPGLPLLGNILQLPQTFLYRQLHYWSKQYGSFYTFWIANRPFVVIGDVSVAADVLDRMSSVSSDRPMLIKMRTFYTRDLHVLMQDRTSAWRSQRRAMHSLFSARAAAHFTNMQAHDAAYMTLGLLQHPEIRFHKHTHRFAASVIIRALYGGEEIPLLGPDPSELMERLATEGTRSGAPQNSLVDVFPFLTPIIQRVKWLRRQADKWHEETRQEATRLFEGALPTTSSGAETFVNHLKSNGEKYGLSEQQSIWLALASYMAGQETSDTALRFFAHAMLHHPHIMREAQSQLDAVCGDRLPTFEHRDRLSYIQAIVRESLRWHSGVPLGLPHAASEDFEYRGYNIPKGTVLVNNLWSQSRDTTIYDDPETFNPSRFLDDAGNLKPVRPETRLGQFGFGHGRRLCPGKEFALNSLFIACAQLLWAFDWDWPVDEKGDKIVCGVEDFVDAGMVIAPSPYDIVMTPRKKGLEERLLAALRE